MSEQEKSTKTPHPQLKVAQTKFVRLQSWWSFYEFEIVLQYKVIQQDMKYGKNLDNISFKEVYWNVDYNYKNPQGLFLQ